MPSTKEDLETIRFCVFAVPGLHRAPTSVSFSTAEFGINNHSRHKNIALITPCSHSSRHGPLPERQFESLSKSAVQLGDFRRRQGRDKMGELTLEHQGGKITTNCRCARQAIFWSQHDLRCQSQNLAIDRGADNGGDVFVLGRKRQKLTFHAGQQGGLAIVAPASRRGVAPGQNVVVYRGEELLGGGRITRSIR